MMLSIAGFCSSTITNFAGCGDHCVAESVNVALDDGVDRMKNGLRVPISSAAALLVVRKNRSVYSWSVGTE
jgi:hypothetical protein